MFVTVWEKPTTVIAKDPSFFRGLKQSLGI